jgi:hypothetical protein
MNGLTTREDVESLFAQLSATLLPVLNSEELSGITIYPESNVVTILYGHPDDVTYDFTVAMDYTFSSERIKAMNENGLLLNEGKDLLMEQGNPIEGIAIYGFVSSENDIEYGRQNFVMDVQGTQIAVTVFRADGIDTALAGLTAFEYKLNAFAE